MASNVTTNDSEPSPSGKTRPCHKIRMGAITCAIWRGSNSDRGSSPDNRPIMYRATVSKLYVDSTGNWADTTSFGRDDLLLLAKVADIAHSWIFEQQQRDRQGHDSSVPF